MRVPRSHTQMGSLLPMHKHEGKWLYPESQTGLLPEEICSKTPSTSALFFILSFIFRNFHRVQQELCIEATVCIAAFRKPA